jgi:tRNA-splicing ligase RtcB (3'-phosphate/5'-hydroxy nucleic acid ligase)
MLKVFGQHDYQTLAQLDDVASRAERVALMADGHVGYGMPIGCVAAYRDRVSVVGVGVDIACGNAAVRTDLRVEDITRGMSVEEARRNPHRLTQDRRIKLLADEIADSISFGVGRKNDADDAPVDHELFLDPAWYAIPNVGAYRDDLMDKARRQLGTVGGGNHYVDVLMDEAGAVWVAVHFGSRGLGFTIAQDFLSLSQGGRWGERPGSKDVPLPLHEPLGQEYWSLMQLAGRYAAVGRDWVVDKVMGIMGASEDGVRVNVPHNFAWREEHDGQELVVVRKGATPARPGELGFVGGSMGDDAVILRGSTNVDEETARAQREALYSTVHGAGRLIGRREALGRSRAKGGRKAKISEADMDAWLAKKGVVRRGGDVDESPQVYRRLGRVLEAQGETIEVVHTLSPMVVAMAGAGDRDPYKD